MDLNPERTNTSFPFDICVGSYKLPSVMLIHRDGAKGVKS